jgi:uncharacterized protein (TIGR03435 family)
MDQRKDAELLSAYIDRQSEAAFGMLVERHVALVYSAAVRQVRDRHLAEEVTQATFVILAQKARGLNGRAVLSGWLCRTAHFVARNALKAEIRRQYREQEAHMQSIIDEPEPEVWPQFAPLLDEAVAQLTEADRDAIVLRFYEQKPLNEVGQILGIDPDTAQKRVSRALEKLRKFFARRGVNSTTAAIAEGISLHSVHAAPAALAKTAAAVALAKGAATSASTLTLTKGALKIMAWTKTTTAIIASVALILALGTATVAIKAAYFPAIPDACFLPNYQHFQNLPRGLFALRPTHFTTPANGLDYSAETTSPSGEHVTLFMGRNRSVAQLINKAYGGSPAYTVLPNFPPKDNFDYLCTLLDSRAGEHLQAAIKKKLGYIADWQQRDTDIFLLKVRTPDAPGLKPASHSGNSETWRDGQSRLEFRNRSLQSLAYEIENEINIPVVDETGRSEALDFDFNCAQADLAGRNWGAVDEALGRLGLELESTNRSMSMLVVRRAEYDGINHR